ncbi:MAG: nitroreductase family protein [Ruminococcus sp.]|nr:nitroreductase family protein [Ruminococcus sp.]
MTIKEAIRERHSVRQYQDRPIEEETRLALEELIGRCNAESGLHIQLICGDTGCFESFLAHYGKFRNVRSYIALVGSSSLNGLEEKCGYFGQRIVLEAQCMGLNTCWVAGTYSKGKCQAELDGDEKLVCVIAIGYGENSGSRHKSKTFDKLSAVPEAEMPDWFRSGMIGAMMAPTAVNQQKFFVELEGDEAKITAKKGFLTKLDLGIVKYNFEAASGHKCR